MSKLIIIAVLIGAAFYWFNANSVRELTDQECESVGGVMTEYGCTQELSQSECESVGGSLIDGACWSSPSESKCAELGGFIDVSGDCQVK